MSIFRQLLPIILLFLGTKHLFFVNSFDIRKLSTFLKVNCMLKNLTKCLSRTITLSDEVRTTLFM